MARRYEYDTNQTAWSLEQCEEIVVIAAYLETLPFIPPTDTWQHEFENHFFVHGNGIAAAFVDRINAVRRRKGWELIDIRETDITDYVRAHDKALHSETRKRFRDELTKATTDERIKRVNRAKSEMKVLAPPHQTYEEWREKRDRINGQNHQSFIEVKRRIEAITPKQPDAVPSTVLKQLSTQKAVTMLKFATKPDVIKSIIAKLSPDSAIEMLTEIDDVELRDELIKHSLENG